MKKKVLALMMIVALTAVMATGCSSGSKETEAATTEASSETGADTEA